MIGKALTGKLSCPVTGLVLDQSRTVLRKVSFSKNGNSHGNKQSHKNCCSLENGRKKEDVHV